MAIVRFVGFGEVTVGMGASLLEAAAKGNIPVGSACGGVCACSTCHLHVTQGRHLLSGEDEEEMDVLDKAFDVRPGSRLGCQARVMGEGLVEVRIPREGLEAYENEHPAERGKYTKDRLTGT